MTIKYLMIKKGYVSVTRNWFHKCYLKLVPQALLKIDPQMLLKIGSTNVTQNRSANFIQNRFDKCYSK